MTSTLTIVGSAIRTDLQLNELPRALAEESPALVVYEWRPVPGQITGAMFDWVAVLGTTADILAVAGALWAVYDKIRKRKKLGFDKPPTFMIQVRND